MTVCILVCKGKLLLSILMASLMCLNFSMQEEESLEHTNAISFVYTYSQLVDHCVTNKYIS